MMISSVLRAILLLACLHALTPTAYLQPGDRARRRQPGHLYQVSVWDEKSRRQKIGFIDRTGTLVIGFDRLPEATVAVGEFHEGRAILVVKEPRARFGTASGFIDETGRVVIEPRYNFARDFSGGLAVVRGDAFSGFIDRGGREVFRNGEWSVGDFHDGLAAVGVQPLRATAGYIDRSGRTVVERKYWFAEEFSEGLAAVLVGDSYSHLFGFINTKGEMVIPPRFAPWRAGDRDEVFTSRFSEGLACVTGKGGYGYIDKRGQFVIRPQFVAAQEFSEGLAWVTTHDGKVGWIDKSGRWAVTLAVNGIHPSGLSIASTSKHNDWRYSGGLVPFATYSANKTLRGYMDRKGRVAIQPRPLNSAEPFVGGLARVTFNESSEHREGKLGYFDRETKQFIEKKYGYIDRAGRFVWRSP